MVWKCTWASQCLLHPWSTKVSQHTALNCGQYRNKVESCYTGSDIHPMWQGLQSITDYKGRPRHDLFQTNSMHFMHASTITKPYCAWVLGDPEDWVISLSEADVSKVFSQVNTRKVAGTDGITGRILRAWTDHLAGIFTVIFNSSLSQSVIPTCFKMTTIIPVPKNSSGFMPQWLLPCSTQICNHEVLWKAGYVTHQLHLRHPRSSPMFIPPQQIHRWCNLNCTSHGLHPPYNRNTVPMWECCSLTTAQRSNTIVPSKLVTKFRTLGLDTSLCNMDPGLPDGGSVGLITSDETAYRWDSLQGRGQWPGSGVPEQQPFPQRL